MQNQRELEGPQKELKVSASKCIIFKPEIETRSDISTEK